ncbi:MAG: hypothetical protein AAFW95_08295 [Cyanobacteria bacterium J06638_6]
MAPNKALGMMLGAIALTATVTPALAQPQSLLVAAETAPATSVPEITSYTYADLFSIAFPNGWSVNEQADVPQVTAVSDGAGDLPPMRTEVTWQDAPPKEVVGESLQAIQASGHTVLRYDATTIDGVTAVRLWLSDIPDEAMPNAFITYVGYPSATATITSYYGTTTTDLDPVLNAIHQSFARSQ